MHPAWRYTLPTALTLGNLLIGVHLCGAMIYASPSNLSALGYPLFTLALLLDGLDGWTARRWGAVSRYGRWLDALADGFSFGLFPALLVAKPGGALVVVGAVYLGAALVRLARFAAQPGDRPVFRGLPVPAAAVIIIALEFLLAVAWQVSGAAYAVPMAAAVAALAVLMYCPLRVAHPVRVLFG